MIGFNVAQLLKSQTGTIRRVEVDELDPELASDLGVVSPTRGTLRLMRTPAGILVTGRLTQTVRLECGRCLDPFPYEEILELNEEFLPTVDVNTGCTSLGDTRSRGLHITPEHVLDLTEAIRQLAILESPLQPLCKEECEGLCPDCGTNLNVEQCGCRREPGGPSGSFGELLAERLREAGFKPEQE